MQLTETLVVEPTSEHDSSVIWMHGLGASADDFFDMPRFIERPGTRWVFPNAPIRRVTLNNGMMMRSWFDILYLGGGPDSDDRESLEEAIESAEIITELIEAEHARGVPYHRIFLIGFSQGGAMTLYTGCRYPHRLAGMVCLSSYLLFYKTHIQESHDSNRNTPVLICHGTHDDLVPVRGGEMTAEFMRENGWPVDFQTYPMYHEVSMEEIRRIGAFISEIIDNQRT